MTKTGVNDGKGAPERSAGAFILTLAEEGGGAPLRVDRAATPPWRPMRASASGAQHDASLTAASGADQRVRQRRLMDGDCEALRQPCWCRAPTLSLPERWL